MRKNVFMMKYTLITEVGLSECIVLRFNTPYQLQIKWILQHECTLENECANIDLFIGKNSCRKRHFRRLRHFYIYF